LNGSVATYSPSLSACFCIPGTSDEQPDTFETIAHAWCGSAECGVEPVSVVEGLVFGEDAP